MTFHDHIDHCAKSVFDIAAANKLIDSLVVRMFVILDIARITKDHRPLTDWASQYGCAVRRLIREAIRAERFALKIAMLKDIAWRLRVMSDLGGLRAFVNWHKRRKTGPKLTRHIRRFTDKELAHQAHIRTCLKATANPLIIIDAFKVDFEGQFRLAPLPRFAPEYVKPQYEPTEHISPPDYEYDGAHKANFRGLNAPISVWPEEFVMFAEREGESLGMVGPKVSEWLKAIARRAEEKRAEARRKPVTGQLVYAPP